MDEAGPELNALVIYTRRMDEMVAFYTLHFGYHAVEMLGDRIVELRSGIGGVTLLLHPAAKGQREGQVLVKLTFTVPDVAAFREVLLASGVTVGALHIADGYKFANLKDPAKNSVSISSRLAAR